MDDAGLVTSAAIKTCKLLLPTTWDGKRKPLLGGLEQKITQLESVSVSVGFSLAVGSC